MMFYVTLAKMPMGFAVLEYNSIPMWEGGKSVGISERNATDNIKFHNIVI